MKRTLKNLNKISYLEIKNYFKKNNLIYSSNLSDDEIFISLNSIVNANVNDLTFMTNNFSLELLKKTKAKACLINKNNLNFLPHKTSSIIVENPYEAFALLSNLFVKNKVSNGVISEYCSISQDLKLNKNVQVDSFVNIKENCFIDSNVIIESNCTIGPNVIISEKTVL